MGNKLSRSKPSNPKCNKCKRALPSCKSSEKRNQYIEGSKYIVHKFSSSEKYFQLVDSDVKYYCFKCMFGLQLDPFQCPRESQNVEKESNLTFTNNLSIGKYRTITETHRKTVRHHVSEHATKGKAFEDPLITLIPSPEELQTGRLASPLNVGSAWLKQEFGNENATGQRSTRDYLSNYACRDKFVKDALLPRYKFVKPTAPVPPNRQNVHGYRDQDRFVHYLTPERYRPEATQITEWCTVPNNGSPWLPKAYENDTARMLPLHNDVSKINDVKLLVKRAAREGVCNLVKEFDKINTIPDILITKCKTLLVAVKEHLVYFQTSNTYVENFRRVYDTRYMVDHICDIDEQIQFLAFAAFAVFTVQRYIPRDVQLLSAILCLIYEGMPGPLLQIHTGEGKSCVIAMIAATFTLCRGKTIDIITSSDLLATRDLENWGKYFESLDIQASKNVGVPDDGCYDKHIVFGTVESFSADFLRHDFQQSNIRRNRQFEIAIVDEVDSMLVDKGIQFTYLCQMVAAMRHLEPILAIIWFHASEIKELYSTDNTLFYQGPPLPVYSFISNILMEIYHDESLVQIRVMALFRTAEHYNIIPHGLSQLYDDKVRNDPLKISELLDLLAHKTVTKFLQFCEDYLGVQFQVYEMCESSNSCWKVSCDKSADPGVSAIQILSLNNGYLCDLHCNNSAIRSLIANKVIAQLHFPKDETDVNEINRVPIPLYLEEHVNTQMNTWISNAFEARNMQPGREYLVKDNAIHPVDFKHTGLIEGNKKWGDGIQQFLEMKHSLALSPMTLITNFVSNVALFKKYNQIYGLSGTLGSTIDRKFLEKIYGTPSFQIPTHKPNKMVDLGGVLKHSKEEWLLEICDTLKRECKLGNGQSSRAALVIAEDISTAKMLVSTIKSIPKANLKLYTRNETDEVKAIKESLQQCDVLVATNLAGRGTNIKVTDDVNQNGGLFVLVTFLPFNERVELQAKGRTSRKGEPGSSKMVILTQNLDKNLSSCHNFNQVLQLRDKEERRKMSFRISEINLVSMKDNLFQSYCKFVKHYISLNEKNNDAIQEEVEDLHEKWGFWLKHKSSEIERESQPDCKIWTDCLKKYLDEVKNEASKKQTPSGSIYNIIKLGNIKCFREEYECAKIYFTQAIERDKIWSSIAYYNRAFCTLSISKSDGMQEAINDLEKAKCLLQHYFNELTVTLTCIKHSRVTQEEDKSNEGHFLRQVQLKFQVLNYFSDKIEKLIKKIDNIAKHKADTEVHADDILSISSLFDDELCCDFLQELWQLGLTQIFHIEKSSRIILDQVIVISIGIAQGLVGALLIPVSSGMLSQIAVGLVCDGVSDILGGAFGIVHGREVKWKSWSINKGVTLAAICLLPCVMKYGKVAGKAIVANKGKAKLVKTVLTETSKTVISDAKCITNAKSVIQGTYQTFSQASKLILKTSGTLVAVEVTKQMVDECFTCVAQPIVMKEIANLLRKILGSCINNVMKDLFEGDEMIKLIIGIEISSKTTDFSGCSNFQKLGEDVLRRHFKTSEKNIAFQIKCIGMLLKFHDFDPKGLKNISEIFKPLLEVLDVCKLGIQRITDGTTGPSSNLIFPIHNLLTESSNALKQGIQDHCDKITIPTFEDKVDFRLEHDKILKANLSKFVELYSGMVCDFHEDLFNQYITRKLCDRLLTKVNSFMPKYLEDERKSYRNTVKGVQTAKSVAGKVNQISERLLTVGQENCLPIEKTKSSKR